MKFKEQKCPKCGGILQVPEELDSLKCMYCGEELKASNLIDVGKADSSKINLLEEELLKLQDKRGEEAILKSRELLKEDPFNYTANYVVAISELPDILLKHKNLMKQFKSKLYADTMHGYIEGCKPVLTCLERACLVKKDNQDEVIKESAEYFIQSIQRDVGNSKGEADDRKMVLALFTIPMILELRLDISELLVDNIIEEWMKVYPKSILRKGDFEQINNGFRKKGLCYITTAVCETLHKPDDCYELVMFRNFRDNYLLKQPDGDKLIQEYYNMAPVIVEHINTKEEKVKIYQSIWQDYLQDCLKAIEDGENEKCKTEYSIMVRDLQKKYARTGGNLYE